MLQLQSETDAERAKLNGKINELTVALDRAKSQLNEKDQTISDMKISRPLVSFLFVLLQENGALVVLETFWLTYFF